MDELGRTLLAGYMRDGSFGHRQHLHMTWSYIRRVGMPDAGDHVVRFIKHVAAHHGGGELYNETMTRFFVYAMAWAMTSAANSDDFEKLLADNPHLTDKHLAERHWSGELLRSPAAKAEWVEPDLKPIPAVPVLAPAAAA